jgi:hypothetical protein
MLNFGGGVYEYGIIGFFGTKYNFSLKPFKGGLSCVEN